MPLILAVDIGTSKLCALAVDAATGQPVGAPATCPNDAALPGLAPGRHEQDPVRIAEALDGLVARIAQALGPATAGVAALALSGQMHGVLLADRATLRPLTPLVTWQDERALEPGPGRLDDAFPPADRAAAAERTGCALAPGYGGATLHWLAAHRAVPATGAVALSIADYIAARWTGRAATEPTHAASWGLLDLAAALPAWDAPLLDRLAIPRSLLPDLAATAAPLGTLRPQTASALGLPSAVQVCAPVGDNQASVIGTVGFGTSAAVVNLGTGGQISLPVAGFVRAAGLETRPLLRGGCLLVGASLCGGWSYAHLCRFYREVIETVGGVPLDEATAYERLNALAAAAPQGAGGLRADTRYRGTRADPALRGAIAGIGADNLTPGHLARAVLEGMVRELAGMIRQPGVPAPREVYASGNAVRKNPLVPTLIEREFAAPCRLADAREEAAIGAARAAARELGYCTV